MKVSSGQDPIVYKLPIYATADIADGALLMPGVTAETDLGALIVATGAGADAIGILRGKLTYATTNRWLADGTQHVEASVELIDRYSIVDIEYDQSDTMAVASTSTTTVTITSLEDNIDASYLYSPVSGNLFYVAQSSAGSCVTKTATGWTNADTAIKILRPFHQLAKLNTAGTKIGTDAGAGSWTVCILQNEFEALGYPRQRLDATKHNGLSLTSPRFFAKVLVRNTAGHTID
jgi:hypothetical protein